MNREIRFRAWNILESEMLYNGFGIDTNGGWWQFADQGFLVNSEDEDDEFVLMQYTGLKDKNGTEIYEGDIVEWCGELYVIKWFHEHAAFMHKAIKKGCIDDYFESNNNEVQEVIGNIYENPELLDPETDKMKSELTQGIMQ